MSESEVSQGAFYATEGDPPEPTDDNTPDGTQLPIEGERELIEDGDAGIGDAEIEYDEDPFAEGDEA